MEPAFQSEGFKAYQKNINNPKFDKLIKVVEELNNVIKEDQSLGAGFRIGHSYFCEKNKDTSDLSLIIEYELLPLLKEYWFDEPSKIEEWVIKLRNAIDG
jgi:5-methylcytosine-specific restriction protein B